VQARGQKGLMLVRVTSEHAVNRAAVQQWGEALEQHLRDLAEPDVERRLRVREEASVAAKVVQPETLKHGLYA
jgi:hypothetical protein